MASCNSDKVLSAGNKGHSLVSKIKRPKVFHLLLLAHLITLWVETRFRKCCTFLTIRRGWLHGRPLAVHLICFYLHCLKPPFEHKEKYIVVLWLFSFPASRVRSVGLHWPQSNATCNIKPEDFTPVGPLQSASRLWRKCKRNRSWS